LKNVTEICSDCQQENAHIRGEIQSLKAMYENKTFELIDAQRELESLRQMVGDRRDVDAAFGQLPSGLHGSREQHEPSDDGSTVTPFTASPQRSISSNDSKGKNLLVMMNEVSMLEQENKTSGSEAEEEYYGDGDLSRTSEPEVEKYVSNPWIDSKKDMLVVYLYLTAAAVKCKYPDIEIRNWELVQLGQDMPFWELYPFFQHLFEGLRMKEKSVSGTNSRRRKTRKRQKHSKAGGWFSWMKGKRPIDRVQKTINV